MRRACKQEKVKVDGRMIACARMGVGMCGHVCVCACVHMCAGVGIRAHVCE